MIRRSQTVQVDSAVKPAQNIPGDSVGQIAQIPRNLYEEHQLYAHAHRHQDPQGRRGGFHFYSVRVQHVTKAKVSSTIDKLPGLRVPICRPLVRLWGPGRPHTCGARGQTRPSVNGP